MTFADGHAEQFDGIVFGTGFDLHLPFLSDDIQATLDLDAVHLDADRYTFHPDLPGLAFVGMWDQSGGYFVPLELQASWIAYTWGGAIAPPSDADQRSSIALSGAAGPVAEDPDEPRGHDFRAGSGSRAAVGQLAGFAPRLAVRPPRAELFPARGSRRPARCPGLFARDAAAFGAITSNELTEREQEYWSLVPGATPTELSAGDRSS